MNKPKKLKREYINFKINKRYHKLSKCNLPFGFYNKRKDKFEWVNYVKYHDNTTGYNNNTYLMDALSDICKVDLTYHYNIKNKSTDQNYQSHSHDFDSVLKELYLYPESFSIPNEYKNNYSTQELNLINEMQKYLLFIELKDFQNSKEYNLIEKKCEKIFAKEKMNLIDKIKIAYLSKRSQKINYQNRLVRCHNKRQEKYQDYGHLIFSKEKIENIINNQQDFLIHYSPFLKNDNDYSSTIGNKYLIKDEDFNILGSIEIIENKIIKFKNLEQILDKKVNNLQSYKNEVKQNAMKLDENFNDESLIIFEKIKMLEKF